MLYCAVQCFQYMLTAVVSCLLPLQEDDKILDLVAAYGAKKWSVIASYLPGRIGKQCRERYSTVRCTLPCLVPFNVL